MVCHVEPLVDHGNHTAKALPQIAQNLRFLMIYRPCGNSYKKHFLLL